MELTHEQIDRWAAGLTRGVHHVRLEKGDSMPANNYGERRIEGPATVSFTAYRDNGGWSAHPLHAWTPEEVAR